MILAVACDMRLKTVTYKVETEKITTPIRIALITDLHSDRYGKNQHVLLESLERQQPDIILLGGDIFDDKGSYKSAEITLKNLSEQYACYYVTGNHEYWSKDIDKAWTPENTNTNVPRLHSNDQYTNATSARWLTSSDYLSLTNLSLGYSFPKSLLNKIKLNGLRVYFTADNVALLAKRKGFDPRQSFGQSTNMQYSAVRTISGGISVKF